LRNLNHAARHLLEALRYGIAMNRAERDDFQDQQVQRALGEAWFRQFHCYYLLLLHIIQTGVEAQGIIWEPILNLLQGQAKEGCDEWACMSYGIEPAVSNRRASKHFVLTAVGCFHLPPFDPSSHSGWSDNQDFGFQSRMIPRRTAIATACARSAAPGFSMMCLM
jgi:hypothetical protein